MEVKKIMEKQSKGIEISKEEQELVNILNEINSKFPPQRRRNVLDIAMNVDEKVRGKINPNTGKLEGGLGKRPSDRSKNKEEKELGKDFQRVQKKTKVLKEKQSLGETLTKEELKIIEIYDNLVKDYPIQMEHKPVLEIAYDLVKYIKGIGDNDENALGRRPRTESKDKFESSMAYKLRNLERKVKILKQQSKDRKLTKEEKDLIKVVDSISIEFPQRQVNLTMLDTALTLEKYIRGGYDERTGIEFTGVQRRPSVELAETDAIERKFLNDFKNASVRVNELQNSERQLSFDEARLIEIITAIRDEYPPISYDSERAIKLITDYIYKGIQNKDGTIVEAIHRLPTSSSENLFEQKVSHKLQSLQHRIRELAKFDKKYEELVDDDIKVIEFLHELDIDYPSRVKKIKMV